MEKRGRGRHEKGEVGGGRGGVSGCGRDRVQ